MFGGFVVFGVLGCLGVTVKRLGFKVKGLRDWG